jgi:tRNA threonylcarbamoyl adenosine modification protein YeaZ
MKILALEFSTTQRSAAVLAEGGLCVSAAETGGRATHAFELIGRALKEAHLEREQIECLAVGLGPGSYTGIRAAIAIAQGWQLARPVKLLGVATTDCLAAQAQQLGWSGSLNLVIDAQQNEFYLARFALTPDERKLMAPLRLASRAEVAELGERGVLLAGPEIQRWFPAGRGLFPDAETLARLAADRADFVPGEKLEPIYLRLPNFVKAPPPHILG